MILAALLGRGRRAQRHAAEARLVEHLPLIERVATNTAIRGGFKGPDVEDFVSEIKTKLIDDNYAVLRKRRGDSSLSTFLVVVIKNHFRDFRNHKWGKYRPTAVALRLGPDAVRLETLLIRDKIDLDAAIEMMITNHRVERSRSSLHALAEMLPIRVGRSFVDDSVLEQRGMDGAVEQRLEDRERQETSAQVEAALSEALATLEPRDHLLLKMHLRESIPISKVAKLLRTEQRSLYSRKDRSLRSLRRSLESRGLTWQRVSGILGWEGLDLSGFDGGLDEQHEGGTSGTGNAGSESV